MLNSAELYDPATGTWTATGSLGTARCESHGDAAAQWQGAGGGRRQWSVILSSAELYDPATGTWTATGNLVTARSGSHGDAAAQWQGAGGGRDQCGFTLLEQRGSCMIRTLGTWTATSSHAQRYVSHTATLLPNGKVLVAGGTHGSALAARSCMIRRLGRGRRPAAWAPHVTRTRRRCCPLARCWWRGESIPMTLEP